MLEPASNQEANGGVSVTPVESVCTWKEAGIIVVNSCAVSEAESNKVLGDGVES